MPEATQETQEIQSETQSEKGPSWTESIKDDGLKSALSKFESHDKLFEAIGYKSPDWRADLPEDLKKVADRFTSKADAVKAIENFRKRESQVRVPGKNATEEEVTAYRKAVGIPESSTDYEFPDLPKDQELTDEIKTSREEWGKRFHQLGVPKATAKALVQAVTEDADRHLIAQIEQDKAFAKLQEDALKTEWKGDDYEKNKILANRAFSEIANRARVNLDDLSKIETRDGRFLMDRAEIVRLFAAIGREMTEGSLGPTMTTAEIETLDDQVRELRKQIDEAQKSGDSKRANLLYQREQNMLARKGNKPLVGAAGRVV